MSADSPASLSAPARKPWQDKATCRHLYHDVGLSLFDLAELWDCSTSTLYRAFEEHDIDRRPRGKQGGGRDARRNGHGQAEPTEREPVDDPDLSHIDVTVVDDARETLDRDIGSLLMMQKTLALKLLDAPDPFVICQTDIGPAEISKLHAFGIVRQVGRWQPAGRRAGDRNVWAVDDGIRGWIREHVTATLETCPREGCRATGIKTLDPDADRYTCNDDECAIEFGAETARELTDG